MPLIYVVGAVGVSGTEPLRISTTGEKFVETPKTFLTRYLNWYRVPGVVAYSISRARLREFSPITS